MRCLKRILWFSLIILCFWVSPVFAEEMEDQTIVGGRTTYQIKFNDSNITWNYKDVTFKLVNSEVYTGTAVTNPTYEVSDVGMTIVSDVANLKYNGNGSFDVFPKQGGALTVKVSVRDRIFDGAIQDGHEVIASYSNDYKIYIYPYLTYNIRYLSSSGKILGTVTDTQLYKTTHNWSPVEQTGYGSTSSQNIIFDDLNTKTIDFIYYPQTYNITYHLDGGQMTGQKTTYNIEDRYTLPTPTKTGYIFAGWTGSNNYSTPEMSVTITPGSTGTKGYTAHWTPITYKVAYNGNGNTGGSTATSTHTYNQGQNLTANGFTKKYTVTYNYNYSGSSNASATANYSFAGWATSSTGPVTYSNGQNVVNLTTVNNGTVNLYAKWNTGSVTLPNASRDGYTFGGWYSNSACTNKVGDAGASYTPSSNITLYAKWTLQNYSISYNLKGGSASNPTSYNVNTASFTLRNPSLSGWNFSGWTGTGLSYASTAVTVYQGSTGNRSYTANYYRTISGSTGAGAWPSDDGYHLWKTEINVYWTGASDSYWTINGRYAYPEEDLYPNVSASVYCDGAWRGSGDSSYVSSANFPSLEAYGYSYWSITTKMGKNCSQLKIRCTSFDQCLENFYLEGSTRYYNSTEYK